MVPPYQQLLAALRQAFPQPVSDPVHDGYVVFSILRALDQVDALKSRVPVLGAPSEPDYPAARAERMAATGRALEAVLPELIRYLHGMFIWSHPRSQINVVPNPSIASIVGGLLPMLYNPNLCSDESGRRFSEAEVRVVAMVADLVGYDPAQADGVFTFGGTGALLYGLKVGLERAMPGSNRRGVERGAVVLCSEQGHYSCLTAAGWLGIGEEGVIRVPSLADNSIDLAALEQVAREAIGRGQRIAAMVATLGTTDAFGLDDLAAMHALRERLVREAPLDYVPHLHGDAVIGWAWSVFNDYDFTANPLGFRGRTVRALAAAHRRVRHLALADSLGVDFHKTGYTPYVSSLFLARDARQLQSIARGCQAMPYLYQTGQRHPGMFTLETTRSAVGPMAALANLLLLGKQGYRALLGHAVEMAETLREHLESHPNLTVLNGQNVGPVTLFRAYPDGVDTFSVKERELHDASYQDQLRAHNAFNRRVFELTHAEALSGHGVVLSLTDCYRASAHGEPIVALKSYVLSPFADESRMASIVAHVLAAREKVQTESRGPP